MCSAKPCLLNLGLQQTRIMRRSCAPTRLPTSAVSLFSSGLYSFLKVSKFGIRNDECKSRYGWVVVTAMDEDSLDFSSFDERMDNEAASNDDFRILSSSESEGSDSEVFVLPTTEGDLPHSSKKSNYSSHLDLSMTGHHLGIFHKKRRRRRIQPGAVLNLGLITFLTIIVLLVDWCSWRIVRLPLPPFYMTRPFFISAVLASISGYVFVPLLESFKFHQIIRKEGPAAHFSKVGTPTMGGLFFIPVGISVAIVLASSSSVEVYGAAGATLSFAAIGLIDDILSLFKNHNYGLPGWIKLSLQAAVGICFSYWLSSTNISSPYSMKFLVPLPAPLGLVYLGKFYLFFSAFCFASMGNGINLTDGLDGLAGGTVACAFIGMSIAVLPICPDLAVFGSSMAGACIGFLLHNRYKASIFMGDTGSLALGGALAAMAACTGMFFPLFIASGVFVIEVISVIMQVSFKKVTERLYGVRRGLFLMAPFHHHLELSGFKEPVIVGGAYTLSLLLSLVAAYIGLISA
ncbi:phospho-N-acetylmuramoyl-pentapeptide-transferase homolog [Aristolochia californica]|uniref:phospho-N-acetylmuramoyl-pentapeptide- transferase homolog n=1 Tax=Aristolochia californica TaxID=171875 RepID=UPI0035DC21EC